MRGSDPCWRRRHDAPGRAPVFPPRVEYATMSAMADQRHHHRNPEKTEPVQRIELCRRQGTDLLVSDERVFQRGETIFEESDTGKSIMVIISGEVRITQRAKISGEETLTVLKKGDFFGEMALLEDLPRSATAIAHSDTFMLEISREKFLRFIEKDTASGVKILFSWPRSCPPACARPMSRSRPSSTSASGYDMTRRGLPLLLSRTANSLGPLLLLLTWLLGDGGIFLLLAMGAALAVAEHFYRFWADRLPSPSLILALAPLLLLHYSSVADFRIRLACFVMLSGIVILAPRRPVKPPRCTLATARPWQVWLLSFLALAAAAVVLYSQRIHLSGDEPHYIIVAQSLVEDGDFDLKNNLDPGNIRPICRWRSVSTAR